MYVCRHTCKSVHIIELNSLDYKFALIHIIPILCLCKQGDKARVIQTILFMAGLNTLLQTILGTRLPTVMGASFAFLLPVLAIINDLGDENFSTGHEVCLVQVT